MSDAAKKLLDEVLALPEDDQRWLSDRLLDRVDPIDDDVREAWNQAAIGRLERLERGEDKPVPWDEAQARIQAALRGE
ncbi:MAG: addiction module protein [Deltaproteobacteria bacterium]|nr:addiction module protein [Deltaproteobacteria bacterium]